MSYAEAPRRLLDYIEHFLWMSLTLPRQAEVAFGRGEGTFPISFAALLAIAVVYGKISPISSKSLPKAA